MTVVAMPVTGVDGSPALKPSVVWARQANADARADTIGDLLRRTATAACEPTRLDNSVAVVPTMNSRLEVRSLCMAGGLYTS